MGRADLALAAPSTPLVPRRVDLLARKRADSLVRLLLGLNVAFLPILIPRGPQNSVPSDVPALVLIGFGAAVLWTTRTTIRLPLGLSYTLILIGGLLGAAQSIAPTVALTATLIDLYIFVWFLVLVNLMRLSGYGAIRTAGVAWVWTGLVVGVVGTIGWALGHERVPSILGYDFVDRFERFSGTFRDPNMAGSYLVMSLFVLGASPWPRRWSTKLLFAVPLLIATQATRSNTALFALAAGIVAAVLVHVITSRRSALAAALVVAACGLAVVAISPTSVVGAPGTVARDLGETSAFSGSLGRFDRSLGARLKRIDQSFRLFGPNLILGIGPSTTNETAFMLQASVQGELHNDYVAGIVERGVIGLIGVVGVMAVSLKTSVFLDARRRGRVGGWSPAALTGGVTAIVVTGLALEALHFRHAWMLFALVFALALTDDTWEDWRP
jgi:hypothetical protein